MCWVLYFAVTVIWPDRMLIWSIYIEVVGCLTSALLQCKIYGCMRPYLVFASDQHHPKGVFVACMSWAVQTTGMTYTILEISAGGRPALLVLLQHTLLMWCIHLRVRQCCVKCAWTHHPTSDDHKHAHATGAWVMFEQRPTPFPHFFSLVRVCHRRQCRWHRNLKGHCC